MKFFGLNLYRQLIQLMLRFGGFKSLIYIFLSIVNGFLEIIGIASIFPVLYVVINKNSIVDNEYVRWAYQAGGFQSYRSFVISSLLILVGFILLKNLVIVLFEYAQRRFYFRVSRNLSDQIYKSIFQSGYQFVAENDKNVLWRDILVNPFSFGSILLERLFLLITELSVLIFIIVLIAMYNYKIVLILLAVILPVGVILFFLAKKKIARMGKEINEEFPKVSKSVMDVMEGYVEVKLLDKFSFFRSGFISSLKKINSNQIWNTMFAGMPQKIVEVLIAVILLTIIIFHLNRNDPSSVIVTSLSIFAASAFRITPSINRIFTSLIAIQSNKFVLDVITKYDSHPQKESQSDDSIEIKNSIVLNNLHFSYPNSDKNVLNGIDLEIKKGQCIGLIGESGSGKSTLIKTFMGLLKDYKGKIALDGNPLDLYENRSWYAKIGYVAQDVFILNNSLKENIAIGEDKLDEERYKEALKLSVLGGLEEQLKSEGINNLGDGGGKVSGGQKQRIGIARALYKNADIFVLDEITSALDNETEKQITESIANLKAAGKTILIIAHRYSSLEHCDTIYELKNGKIVSESNFDKLKA